VAAFALFAVPATAGLDVVRVRVPAKDVTRFFPPGTELRVLAPEDFESRVAAARSQPAGGRPAVAPRIIRARHRARWESGLLRGHSELVVGAGAAGPVEVTLEPWTPAILSREGPAPAVGARDSGGAVLRVDAAAGEQTVEVEWEQQPRPLSRARGFSLGLPSVETTVLELELPRGWTTSSRQGIRRGPLPAAEPSSSLWEIDGESGRFEVEIRDASDRDRSGAGSGAWVSCTTEVDLRRKADPADALRNWSADCRLELDPRHARRLEVELDPGLELIDVGGEAVRGYRTEHPATGTRVVVTIAEGVRSTTLHFVAHARVPSEGAWRIPALRPLDATWTGGRTTVIVDPLRAVSECRERAGRLVPPGRGNAAAANRLAFEAEAPRSVAELVFIRPRPEVACTVRGQLDMGRTPARLDCHLDYSVSRGSVSQLEIELSPAWLPDQVRIQRLADPLAWHSSTLPSGATQLRVMLPASVLAQGKWTLIIGATTSASAARGPLELPRVRPIRGAVVDETWVAWGDEAAMIQPVRARGLAWLDPTEISGPAPAPPSPGLRQILAWRWTAADAEARVERERLEREPRASIRARARIGHDGREISIEGTLLVGSGASGLEVLPVWVDAPGDLLASWRFSGEDGGELRLRPIEGAARAQLGLPRRIAARALPLNLPALTEKTVSFRATMPWSSGALVPLLCVPAEYLKQGIIVVETAAGMKSSARPIGLGRLNPAASEPWASLVAGEHAELGGVPRDRIVHAFSYTEPGAHLELDTEPRVPSPMPGVVREALLTTSVDGHRRTLNRLRLVLSLHQAGPLELVLPEGSTLVRVRRDGADVSPIRSGPRLAMPALPAGTGTRSSTIVVDYLMEVGLEGDGSILRPDRPRLDLPCLSFAWEIAAPAGWQVLDPGAGLVVNDPADPADWPCRPLGLGTPDWPLFPGRGDPGPAERLRQLDEQLKRPAPAEWSFTEWFSRWDSGPWPLIVDRLALGSAGLGPRSSCFPGRLAADRRNPARALLHQNGLTVVAFADALLVTTEYELPHFERRGPWLAAIAESLAWGSDRTDRFQTVDRWRGEVGPRTGSAPGEAAERNRPLPGRLTRRFSASGWPGGDAFVCLVDARRRALVGWLLAGSLAMAWLVWPGRASGRRLVVPALAAAACVLLDRVLPARSGALTAGGFAGSLAILIAGLARRLRRAPSAAPADVRTESSLLRRGARAATGLVSLVLASLALGSSRAEPAGDDAPIVALFPYEGTFDPARLPDRVILRLEDFRRLTRRAADLETRRSSVTAISAAHRVARRSEQEILVETELELAARGPGPFVWRIPVSSARDISATLGGQPVPIAVEAGGDRAVVVLPQAGNYLLRVRRWAAVRTDAAGAQVLSLPVNAAPMALLVVEPPADRMPQGTAVTRGRVERRPDQSLAGRLGPSDRIIVQWTSSGRAYAPREVGPVDGLMLWDVTPAGDRLRARLTYHRNEEIASIRLAHEAGLMLRSVRADGPSRVYWEDDAESGQWLLSFDPPLSPAGTLSVECWRSSPDSPGVAGTPAQDDRTTGVSRHFPSIRPVSAERFTGVLGVRRPGDWTGRLVPMRDTEPFDDEAFVKAWGPLPEEPLTLCGTSRFNREPVAELHTGPVPPRLVIRPAAEIRIESGRIVMAVDAEIQEVFGHSPITEAVLPDGMELTGVSGDGLIDWTVSAGRRLHLIWRRRESGPPRSIHLLGWIPLNDDPLRIGVRAHRVRTPWVDWPGAAIARGSLTVTSRTNATIRGGAGLSSVPADVSTGPVMGVAAPAAGSPSGGGGPGPPVWSVQSYQVNDPARLGELGWESPPPRVSVAVESLLTIHADFAQWVAVIRYDVIGGGLNQIDLRIPMAWAQRAKLQIAGEDPPPPPRIEPPSAFFSIAPTRPLWGSHRLVLRSRLPLGSGREVVYPELAPLGRGAVDAYLGIVNATGRPLAAEDATGLQSVPYASRFRDREFARDAGTPAGAYRVVEKLWALRVQLPPGATEPAGSRDDAARVSLADVALSVMPDRSVLGRALYEVVPDSGRLLTVELPPGSTILWAAVEPNATAPLRAGSSAWSIVLGSGRPERVCLIWRTPPPDAAERGPGRWPLSLPRAGLGAVQTLLSVSTPSGVTVEGTSASFERVAIASLDKARADWLGQSLRDSLAKLDRSSGRDHERLVALLINHELALRAADRAAHRDDALEQGSVGQRELLQSIAAARAGVDKTVRSAGLTDDLNSARSYLGLPRDAVDRPPGGIPEPIAPCRIRAFGRPTAMIGVNRGLDEPSSPASLTLAGGVADGYLEDGTARPLILSALIAVAAVLATLLGGRRAPLAAALALVLMLAAAALAGGPTMLAGGLGLAVIARVGWASPTDSRLSPAGHAHPTRSDGVS
jgi:hypothetical protein